MTASPGPRSVRRLQQCGHVITGLKVGTVLFGKRLMAGERVTHLAISPSSQEVTNGACHLRGATGIILAGCGEEKGSRASARGACHGKLG